MTNNSEHTTEQFEELCSGYVLHALDAEDKAAFESMLQHATQEELQLYHELQSTANHLAFAADREAPSDTVLDRIMRSIGLRSATTTADSKTQPSSGLSRSAMAIAAAFALLLISVALVFYSFNLNSEISSQDDIIARQESRISELENDVNRKEELLSILGARTVSLVAMNGLEVNPDGYGKIIWDPDKNQALLQVANLPTVPRGKDYQLWLIKDNKPISAGVFAVDNAGDDSFFKIENLSDANNQSANAFAVTLEKEGGVPQPTGDMYLLGNVNAETN